MKQFKKKKMVAFDCFLIVLILLNFAHRRHPPSRRFVVWVSCETFYCHDVLLREGPMQHILLKHFPKGNTNDMKSRTMTQYHYIVVEELKGCVALSQRIPVTVRCMHVQHLQRESNQLMTMRGGKGVLVLWLAGQVCGNLGVNGAPLSTLFPDITSLSKSMTPTQRQRLSLAFLIKCRKNGACRCSGDYSDWLSWNVLPRFISL